LTTHLVMSDKGKMDWMQARWVRVLEEGKKTLGQSNQRRKRLSWAIQLDVESGWCSEDVLSTHWWWSILDDTRRKGAESGGYYYYQ
jgi:hypothetical protein